MNHTNIAGHRTLTAADNKLHDRPHPKDNPLWDILLDDFPGYIYHKKIHSMAYINANNQFLELIGLKTVNDIVNKTTAAIPEKTHFASFTRFVKFLDQLEKTVIHDKISCKDSISEPFLDDQGQILQLSLSASYLSNPQSPDEDSIIVYGRNITPATPHNELRITYNHFYDDKKVALTKFLEHIGFSSYITYKNRITPCEFEVLRILADGNTAKEVARKLHISSRTVETHLDKIKIKIEARNKIEVMKKFLSCYKA